MNDFERTKRAKQVLDRYLQYDDMEDHIITLALVKRGVDVKAKDSIGNTILHWATHRKGDLHLEISQLLIEQDTDIHATDHEGETPLHGAIPPAAKLLLDRGAEIEARNNNGYTPLHLAAANGKTETVKFLLEQGADIHALNKTGNTPLHRAAKSGNTKTVKMLLEQGADIHARNNDGDTPLHVAVWFGYTETVKYLLEQKADIYARNRWSSTPLHLTAKSGNTKVVKLLLAHGTNIWAKNDKDNTGLIEPHREQWEKVLEEVRSGDLSGINTTQDIYHLASVMQPENPKNVPPPKEFIRLLFQQYLPHDDKFNGMYEEIFSQHRPPQYDLKAAREAAKTNRLTIL